MKQLVEEQPEYFARPFTLVVLVDKSPCVKAFIETRWWRDWQRVAEKAGCGFLFATSHADSVDVAVATALEDVNAPILIFPSCDEYVLESGLPNGYLPLKLLVDRRGLVHRVWYPVIDTVTNNRLMFVLDSVTSAEVAETAVGTH
ncbi:MAG: hypothetical protein AAB305_00485 [Candidatus Zixiibacteriota bacterium]